VGQQAGSRTCRARDLGAWSLKQDTKRPTHYSRTNRLSGEDRKVSFRWIATVKYLTDTGISDIDHQFEAMFDLHNLIEQGPNLGLH
jgi:hypothetical protein